LQVTAGTMDVTVAEIGGGSATISGTSVLEFNAASDAKVTFAAGSTGELLLLNSSGFAGSITGFTGTGTGTPATSDKLDLRDISFSSTKFNASYANNVLTVTDGTHTANLDMVGAYTLSNFHFAADGSGGTLVTDPPGPNLPQHVDPVMTTAVLLRQYMAASFGGLTEPAGEAPEHHTDVSHFEGHLTHTP
jgi:hypothetical protein